VKSDLSSSSSSSSVKGDRADLLKVPASKLDPDSLTFCKLLQTINGLEPWQLNTQLQDLLGQLRPLLVSGRFDVLLLPHGPLLGDLKRVS
jgi:hypothetical protein